ncbi:MAG: hypothetical protein JWQ74_3107 [Marmoricola sp.]|nr:hypothetical protein [Marmoricola sp.]
MRERSWDRTGVIALVVALLAGAGMVYAVPSLVPRPVRDLVGLGPERVAPALAVRSSGSYAFLAHQPGDTDDPVGYDPCSRIPVRVNLAHAPAGGLPLVEQAIARVESVTGLRFDLRGTTDQRPHWDGQYLPVFFGKARTAPALISWADEREVPELAGNVAGIGGSVPISDLGGHRRYATGGVTLDADSYAELEKQPEGRAEELAILLHELGHLVGLAHVHDPAELMNEDNLGNLDFGPGDLEGLAKIGAVACA